jgi:hypothetical protein
VGIARATYAAVDTVASDAAAVAASGGWPLLKLGATVAACAPGGAVSMAWVGPRYPEVSNELPHGFIGGGTGSTGVVKAMASMSGGFMLRVLESNSSNVDVDVGELAISLGIALRYGVSRGVNGTAVEGVDIPVSWTRFVPLPGTTGGVVEIPVVPLVPMSIPLDGVALTAEVQLDGQSSPNKPAVVALVPVAPTITAAAPVGLTGGPVFIYGTGLFDFATAVDGYLAASAETLSRPVYTVTIGSGANPLVCADVVLTASPTTLRCSAPSVTKAPDGLLSVNLTTPSGQSTYHGSLLEYVPVTVEALEPPQLPALVRVTARYVFGDVYMYIRLASTACVCVSTLPRPQTLNWMMFFCFLFFLLHFFYLCVNRFMRVGTQNCLCAWHFTGSHLAGFARVWKLRVRPACRRRPHHHFQFV